MQRTWPAISDRLPEMRYLILISVLTLVACGGEHSHDHSAEAHDDHGHAPKYGGSLVELGEHARERDHLFGGGVVARDLAPVVADMDVDLRGRETKCALFCSIAWRTRDFISSISASVASRSLASLPITNRRTALWPT